MPPCTLNPLPPSVYVMSVSAYLPELSEEELAELDVGRLEFEMNNRVARLKELKPNMTAIAEYRKKVTLVALNVSFLAFFRTVFTRSGFRGCDVALFFA